MKRLILGGFLIIYCIITVLFWKLSYTLGKESALKDFGDSNLKYVKDYCARCGGL